MVQEDRDWVLNSFRSSGGGVRMVIATDVAARGLDIKDIKVREREETTRACAAATCAVRCVRALESPRSLV